MSELTPSLGLCVPLYNEERNLDPLVEDLLGSELRRTGLSQLVLVDNGSSDGTRSAALRWAERDPLVRVLVLEPNDNYGGGVWRGLRALDSEYIGWLPGDLQVSALDVTRVWNVVRTHLSRGGARQLIAKGLRTVRHDPLAMRVVSRVYTQMSNAILDLAVRDVNGLPKIAHREILAAMRGPRARSFVFDAQVLRAAQRRGWSLLEVPVTFHARRAGVSTWSGKRLRVYRQSLQTLLSLRARELFGREEPTLSVDG